ncbi:MAG TPA: GntR family transcriptional regulator [Acidimicrobiales bacterium]|nr:GntR family transcriptional regulator [Acidimicrobiales bacterium]
MAVVRWQRVAELVADDVREQILSGRLESGAVLPKEELLRSSYPVSKASLREAMRILEAEGLVTVRRGNVGGAVVRRPSAGNVAYALALVLRADGVLLPDVARALREVEPLCAGMCAERSDRRRNVVPRLRAAHSQALSDVDDLARASQSSRRFHECLVELCGNRSLAVMAGALETIWSSHETGRTSACDPSAIPLAARRAALDAHGELIQLIAAGDVSGARRLAGTHLDAVQSMPAPNYGEGRVVPLSLRY